MLSILFTCFISGAPGRDDCGTRTYPALANGRLEVLLGALDPLIQGLAHLALLAACVARICGALLRCLRLQESVSQPNSFLNKLQTAYHCVGWWWCW